MQVICFHNPEEENGYLSNWYLSNFMVDKVMFTSMEQFMMYRKADCFGDTDIVAQIMHTKNVLVSKNQGGVYQGIMIIIGMESDKLLFIRDFALNFLKMKS